VCSFFSSFSFPHLTLLGGLQGVLQEEGVQGFGVNRRRVRDTRQLKELKQRKEKRRSNRIKIERKE